jgi:hypothetical protein
MFGGIIFMRTIQWMPQVDWNKDFMMADMPKEKPQQYESVKKKKQKKTSKQRVKNGKR